MARAPCEGENIKDAIQCPHCRFPFAPKNAQKVDKLKVPKASEEGYSADESEGDETETNQKQKGNQKTNINEGQKIHSDYSSVKRKAKAKAKAKAKVF